MTFLTERQHEVLQFIKRRIDECGIAPTLQEISNQFGFSSTASAQKHVNLLVQKGLLSRDRHQKRGLTVVSRGDHSESPDLPLLGTVAAGFPIESLPDDERVFVPHNMVGRGDRFVLRIRGDSMIEEGIQDGDLVVVKRRETARDGETVVALVDGEATLKRLYRRPGGMIVLQPANEAMPAIVVREDSVRIQGVLVGLLRTY